MRGRLRRWGVGLAGWALAGLFFATQNQVAYLQYDSPPPFRTTLARAPCHWMAWAPFAPFILWLARRYPFARGRIGRALAVHAAGAAAVVTGKLWLDAAARALILGDRLRVGLRGPPREGVGIGNARARLLELYGPGERLAIAGRPEGGVIVTLRVPYVEDA
jgi:hypothetical protein